MSDTQSPSSYREMNLEAGQRVFQLLYIIKEKFGILVDVKNILDTEVFLDTDGFLTLQIVERDSGNVLWVFKCKGSVRAIDEVMDVVRNPKAFLFKNVIENFTTFVNTEKELEFLKDMTIDVRCDSGSSQGHISYRLMKLMNNYRIGDGWSCNPGNSRSTAYFILRYLGPGDKAPDVFRFNRGVKMLAVVDVLINGEYKTHAIMVG